jgi:hypothetical protein
MSGAGGTVEITDPTVPSAPQAHSANIALFGNYIANFAAEGHGALLDVKVTKRRSIYCAWLT